MFVIKLGTCIYIFGQHISGINTFNEWNREKSCMETYSEIRESKMTEIMTAELWLLHYYYKVYKISGT